MPTIVFRETPSKVSGDADRVTRKVCALAEVVIDEPTLDANQ